MIWLASPSIYDELAAARYSLQQADAAGHLKEQATESELCADLLFYEQFAMTNLKDEIVQERPFSSAEEKALLNLLRSADTLERAVQQRIRPWGITATQYNVLRILRGAEPQGLPCAAIGSRMITAEPDITRLLSRLKALKLVRQRRDRSDRRVVWTQISEAGLELLRAMDPEIERGPREMLGHMSAEQLAELTRLLELARKCSEDPGAASCSCDGSESQK